MQSLENKLIHTAVCICIMQELFYLLDDMNSEERGGVVTVASLAVELQAGGLTEEHVEFVCCILAV